MAYTNTDKGDYVLPGVASTYPAVGLHGRYSNNGDLQNDSNRLLKIHAPSRMSAYNGGSGPGQYADQQDAQINVQQNPTPGAATSLWSCIWFGAIWLKLSAGNYTLQLNTPATTGCAVRVWIGNLQFGQQLVDQWTFSAGSSTFSFTVTAANLAGKLSNGRGSVQRDGWYPIKVEYAVDSTAHTAPALYITNSPAAYTDPGGTAIASGSQATVIPSTSLSPLGCVDQRYQGVAHFDLVQQTLQAAGYQASLEPQQLESGAFPGVLAPRIREGADYDTILEPDDGPRPDPINQYSNTLDATDSVASLQGNGAGFQSGNTGQLQADVYDPTTLQNSLFDVQGWNDFSDASYGSLLAALLNSMLGLRLTPWQTIAADPSPGRTRLANLWPLPAALWPFKWRPGDGVRVQARDINVQDTTPRQMLEVTRQFTPDGTTAVNVTLASGPAANTYPNYSNSRARSPAKALKQMLYAATRWQRNYQRQLVTLQSQDTGQISVTAGSSGTNLSIALQPSDQIVRAYLRVANNSTNQSLQISVNGTNDTAGANVLNGPWTGSPITIDLMPLATVSSSNVLIVNLKNNGGSTTVLEYQLFVDAPR